MPRPKIRRHLRFQPHVKYFKPRGVPMRQLEEVALAADEIEAVKLHDVDQLTQTQAAGKMKVSQPTFNRILNRAYHKIGKALVKGMAIRLVEKS